MPSLTLGAHLRTRSLAAVLGALVLVAVVGLLAPADAGNGNYVVVDKVVDGPVPVDTLFEIEVDCSPYQNGNSDATVNNADSDPVILKFDDQGEPLTTDMVPANLFESCKVTETVTGGATVSYACKVGSPTNGVAGSAADAQVECVDVQTVVFGEVSGAEGTVTVTNTFEPEPEPEPAPAAAPAGVVAARPAFTG